MHAAAMLSIETIGSSDLNIVFIFRVFLEFGNQVLFGLSRVQEHRAGELSDKNATGSVFDGVAGMDADALKAGHIVDKRQYATEMRGFGQRQFVPAKRDSSFGMGGVGYCGWFKCAAKGFATDKKDARCFVGRGVGSD